MPEPFSEKQLEFLTSSNAKHNLAHGSVRSGKTVCSLFRFMMEVDRCPDSQIWMIGHTSTTIFSNAIRLLLEPRGKDDPLAVFTPFCTWREGKNQLLYKDKTISTCGARDEGSVGVIHGLTISLMYCDEMALYPASIIQMLHTRLSNPHSKLFATMNPSHPGHILKSWIDLAREGDPLYYELKFLVEDNPFLPKEYISDIKKNLTGVYYKRLYLGEWCLAEGSIFDFFDREIHVAPRPPTAAHYWVVGIDYGTNNSFAAVLVGINRGQPGLPNSGKKWVEKEFYWDSKKTGRQKSPSEYARDVQNFIEPYGVKSIYIDPSALFFKKELQRLGLHPVEADNDVDEGIKKLHSELKNGSLVICDDCPNLIREIEGYVWDPKKAEKGYDEPVKKDDHAIDALRYAIFTHKVSNYDHEKQKQHVEDWKRERYYLGGRQYS